MWALHEPHLPRRCHVFTASSVWERWLVHLSCLQREGSDCSFLGRKKQVKQLTVGECL